MSRIRERALKPVGRLLVALFALGVLGCGAVHGQVPEYAGTDPLASTKGKEVAVLAGGCFWGVDAVFKHVKGVKDVI
jgi:peptide-methionine (S)-S-oxide reductase